MSMATVVSLNTEGSSTSMLALATKKVLVIDDQKNARVILEGVVRCVDPYIEVKAFASPLEAIEWARTNTFDLVLTDYNQSELEGIEAIKRVRKLPSGADMPILRDTVSEDAKIRH